MKSVQIEELWLRFCKCLHGLRISLTLNTDRDMKSFSLSIIIFLSFCFVCSAQKPINWTEKQLMEPATLAASIKSQKDIPVILSVGPGAVIPGSIDLGMGSTDEGIAALESQLKNKSKDEKIVIYCGCCPFERCPNVRPAIDLLKKMNFSNYYLLNIPNNIKMDWINKGFPSTKP